MWSNHHGLPSEHPLLTTLHKLGSLLSPGATSADLQSLWHEATSTGYRFHDTEQRPLTCKAYVMKRHPLVMDFMARNNVG